jgi:hypothetical protein
VILRVPYEIIRKELNYLIKAITKHNNATNSARARAIIPGVNIAFAASGLREIPLIQADPTIPIARAAAAHPTVRVRAKRSIIGAVVDSIIIIIIINKRYNHKCE